MDLVNRTGISDKDPMGFSLNKILTPKDGEITPTTLYREMTPYVSLYVSLCIYIICISIHIYIYIHMYFYTYIYTHIHM